MTGAAGFVGRHLVRRLVEEGTRVRASDRAFAQEGRAFFDRLGVELVTADLARPDTLEPLFEGDVDRVFHLGAICNFSTPFVALEPVNVRGVRRVADLALAARVRCFVHVSSTSVYGRYRGSPFTEESLREPQDDYGRSKKAGEDEIFAAMERGLPTVVARPCTVYGPGCNDGAGKAFSRRTSIPAIPGSGRQKLANVRVEDVARALVHLSTTEGTIGHAYNVVDRSQPTVEEALGLAASAFGARPPRLHLPLGLLSALARVSAAVARRRGTVPDLEQDALRYLRDDYVVDGSKLAATGFELLYPDFSGSLAQMVA
ncbi:MAG: NAD-dependent epimerase/dehydratase family protein [Sandaracinaceae bacterium]|nr:NAD-dependent epimerase/dehydratase family protein [Sandaracinaceae bacterium]